MQREREKTEVKNTKVSRNSIYISEIKREKSVTSREVHITRQSTLIHHAKKHTRKTNIPQKFIPYSRTTEMGDL